MEQFERTQNLIGKENLEKLKKSKVIIFGIGGVGSYTLEALARVGVHQIDIVDNDKVNLSNINRQLVALHSTLGEYKVDVAKKRCLDINPDITINAYKIFFNENTIAKFDFRKYDYIIDAIDSVKSKILLVELANKYNVKIISSMGAGNKLDPSAFLIEDIYKTSVCPLARVMRNELKKRGIKKLKVVYSKETPVKLYQTKDNKRTPSSISFVPSAVGLIIASVVTKELIKL